MDKIYKCKSEPFICNGEIDFCFYNKTELPYGVWKINDVYTKTCGVCGKVYEFRYSPPIVISKPSKQSYPFHP